MLGIAFEVKDAASLSGALVVRKGWCWLDWIMLADLQPPVNCSYITADNSHMISCSIAECEGGFGCVNVIALSP